MCMKSPPKQRRVIWTKGFNVQTNPGRANSICLGLNCFYQILSVSTSSLPILYWIHSNKALTKAYWTLTAWDVSTPEAVEILDLIRGRKPGRKAGGGGSLKTKYPQDRWSCWPAAAEKAIGRTAWGGVCAWLPPMPMEAAWVTFSLEGRVLGVGVGHGKPWSPVLQVYTVSKSPAPAPLL